MASRAPRNPAVCCSGRGDHIRSIRVLGVGLIVAACMPGARSLSASAARTPQNVPSAGNCVVSEDAAYGYTRENPVKVGGGVAYGPARERRYLDVLRGPAGQSIKYRRLGSGPGSDQNTILDQYEITYEGLEHPVHLFVDQYHFEDPPAAPKGFTCSAAIGLQPPGPDPFAAPGVTVPAE